MNLLQSSFFWFFCFTVIFLLSLDFWTWKPEISLSFFYLPEWVFYFIGLQIILAAALLLFTLKFWKTPEDENHRI
jgi:hypothetical protein